MCPQEPLPIIIPYSPVSDFVVQPGIGLYSALIVVNVAIVGKELQRFEHMRQIVTIPYVDERQMWESCQCALLHRMVSFKRRHAREVPTSIKCSEAEPARSSSKP